MSLKFFKLLAGALCFTTSTLTFSSTESRTIEELSKGTFHFEASYLEDLAHTQKPKVLIIACSDSRVDPALITGSLPGDIFVVRNIANLVPSYDDEKLGNGATGAALEYAVNSLKVSDIVIMGHSNCGGIKALIARDENAKNPNGEFIDAWLDIDKDLKASILAEKHDLSKAELHRHTEIVSVANSAKNLLTYPWIKKAVEAKTLSIRQWYFDIEHKEILILE